MAETPGGRRPRVLVIGLTDLAIDGRVRRELEFLSEDYDVVVAAFGPAPSMDAEFVRLPSALPSVLRQRAESATRVGLRLAGRYDAAYRLDGRVRKWRGALESALPADAIVVNNLVLVPLAFALAAGTPVIFDAQEHWTSESESWTSVQRLSMRGAHEWIVDRHLPHVAEMLTVSAGLAREYEQRLGVLPSVVTNAPYFQPLSPSPVAEPIRLVHFGVADERRRLEDTIEAVRDLEGRFTLDLALVRHNDYRKRVEHLVATAPNIRLIPPVPQAELRVVRQCLRRRRALLANAAQEPPARPAEQAVRLHPGSTRGRHRTLAGDGGGRSGVGLRARVFELLPCGFRRVAQLAHGRRGRPYEAKRRSRGAGALGGEQPGNVPRDRRARARTPLTGSVGLAAGAVRPIIPGVPGPPRILSVVGARPEIIQAARLTAAFQGIAQEVLVHTGQHYDAPMSGDLILDSGLPEPRYNLGVGSRTDEEQLAVGQTRLAEVIAAERPDAVLVRGDTNATLAGARAAAEARVPLMHVEAGCRSWRPDMPEERNRVETDRLADLLFAPTETTRENLEAEGVKGRISVTGDVLCDMLESFRARIHPAEGDYVLATVHRNYNTDDPERLSRVLQCLGRAPGRVVLPIHPRTGGRIREWTLEVPANVELIEPVTYSRMLSLERGARAVATDSGGVQREAYVWGVPCVTLREETEWVETVEVGWNTCVGVDADLFAEAIRRPPPDSRPPIFGDGHAAERIAREAVAFPAAAGVGHA